MSNIDKRALREAAEKATPGPWCIARNGKTITSNQSHPVAVITEDFHRMLANGKTGGDAEFISAANPVTVLALLDELGAAEKRNAELEVSHAQVINARDNYKRVASEGIQSLAEARAPTVKVPELSDEKFWIKFAGRLVFREETYRSAVINALAAAGITAKWE